MKHYRLKHNVIVLIKVIVVLTLVASISWMLTLWSTSASSARVIAIDDFPRDLSSWNEVFPATIYLVEHNDTFVVKEFKYYDSYGDDLLYSTDAFESTAILACYLDAQGNPPASPEDNNSDWYGIYTSRYKADEHAKALNEQQVLKYLDAMATNK